MGMNRYLCALVRKFTMRCVIDGASDRIFTEELVVLSWLFNVVTHFISFQCRDVWEKKPLLLKRRQVNYNNGWFSTKEFDDILREVSWTLVTWYLCKTLKG